MMRYQDETPDCGILGRRSTLFGIVAISLVATGCATVKVQAPDKPIEINLNVKIEQELRIKLDKDIEDLISGNPDIF